MYKYYTPIMLKEHGAFAKELAAIFTYNYGWATVNGKTPDRFINAILQTEEAKDKSVQKELYYETRYGLSRVYLHGMEYIEKYAKMLEEFDEEIVCIEIGGKKYRVKKKSPSGLFREENADV